MIKYLTPALATLCISGCQALNSKDRIILAEQYPSIPAHQPLMFQHMIGTDRLVMRSEPKFAGAISSVTFRGQEYVNSDDHGRLMQGATALNSRFECLNPTQAGGSRDRNNFGQRSSSKRLRSFGTPDGGLTISTRMAYWLRPGMMCTIPGQGRAPVENKTRISPDVYSITYQFGLNGHANVASLDISYSLAGVYQSAVLEALTIYTPPHFNSFHTINPVTLETTEEPTLKPDETASPVILSTADGAHAIAFVSLQPGATYARYRFPDTSKISLVYRDTDGITGRTDLKAAWVIGTRDEVSAHVRELISKR
jgi:hypothetical protein